MCLNIRAKLLMLPAKLSPRLAQIEGNQAEIFDEMKKAVDEVLEELSDYRTLLTLTEDDHEEESD